MLDKSRVYYDLNISNINTATGNNPVLKFSQTYGSNILDTPKNYYMSIIRFSLDTSSLPVFLPTITPSQSNPNLTIYSVSMSYGNYVSQAYIQFIPQDQTQSTPPPPSSNSNGYQTFVPYYYIYNYTYFIKLINTALTTCFNSLQNQVTLPTTNVPYLAWDASTDKATLVTDNAGFNDSNTNPISLYFNNALYQLFCSFPMYINSTTTTQGLNYRISCNGYGQAPTETLSTYTKLYCAQEHSTINLWSPISSIVFTSNTLPINNELVSAPSVYLNAVTQQSTNNNKISQTVADFESGDLTYKPYLAYQPNIYRYIDLKGDTALQNIDISCYWKNNIGDLIPFYLNAGDTASMKIMFCLKQTQN
nr:MAG: putative minor capsid protein [Lake Baikal virophage 9]